MSIYIINFLLILEALTISYIQKLKSDVKLVISILFTMWLCIFIGLRHEVGGDWNNYLRHYEELYYESFAVRVKEWNPGYVIIQYISKYLGLGIYGVNTIAGLIFLCSFWVFLTYFKIPAYWGFLIAYPYVIMVVVNGYTRQGVALGFLLIAIRLLCEYKIFLTIGFLMLASTFHESALIFSLWIAWEYVKNDFSIRKLVISVLFLFLIGILLINLSIRLDTLVEIYINRQLESKGQMIRGFVNLLPFILLIIFRNRWQKRYGDWGFWILPGLVTFILTFVGYTLNISTLADRLTLYFYPIQFIVYPRLINLINTLVYKYVYIILVVLLHFSMLISWLLFAIHRDSWVPYNNLLFLKLNL